MNAAAVIAGRTILVTGGTGTIGRALTRRLLALGAATVRVLSRDEGKHATMRAAFARDADRLRFLVGDVRDPERMRAAARGVEGVFHLAAMKHVSESEYNPGEAVRTNVAGTENVLHAAIDNDVEFFVAASSDKAVNPTNVMGASKLLAEKVVISAAGWKGDARTRFGVVRFGNVLGSSGSVLPIFLTRVHAGKPLQVRGPGMRRFALLESEAVDALLFASESCTGGEIVIPKMPVFSVEDLAHLIQRATHRAAMPLVHLSAQEGEKTDEEVWTDEEGARLMLDDGYYKIAPHGFDVPEEYATTGRRTTAGETISRHELGELIGKVVVFPTAGDAEERCA